MEVKFDSLEKHPYLIAFNAGRERKFPVPIDFSNWNSNQEFITIKDTVVARTY